MFQRISNSTLGIIALVLLGVFLRIMPHPANLAPIGGIAILSGLVVRRKYAIWSPVAAMVVSDLFIGLHPLILWTWGSYALIAFLSSRFLYGKKLNGLSVIATGVTSGLLFYLITNFGVWLQGGLYTLDGAGIIRCYVNALPFLRNTILGDVFYTAALYAAYQIFSLHQQTKRAVSI